MSTPSGTLSHVPAYAALSLVYISQEKYRCNIELVIIVNFLVVIGKSNRRDAPSNGFINASLAIVAAAPATAEREGRG
jgi:hypothetical protein